MMQEYLDLLELAKTAVCLDKSSSQRKRIQVQKTKWNHTDFPVFCACFLFYSNNSVANLHGLWYNEKDYNKLLCSLIS